MSVKNKLKIPATVTLILAEMTRPCVLKIRRNMAYKYVMHLYTKIKLSHIDLRC